ncbi:hypothetical protein WA1_12080 [Scytonema hofmannii PCC 7110]|uniref:Uncharacterized protein n=1 Tax=Scytonema hofmannii PCC 7110 TaxID=128403 RepID=A0A139XDV2_9CYAN|nr:hypothetical protein [Scytonema hofmannii]KYC42856.1 hypothetical protein WA1_12080 [Scytonema hofmannii PCC 7110]
MLKTSLAEKTYSVENLLNLWLQRFTLHKFSLSITNTLAYDDLLKANSLKGRAITAAKLKDTVLDVNCQMAWIQTKDLYGYIPNILDLNEARRITQFAFRVYRKLLEVYQQHSIDETVHTAEQKTSLPIWGIAELEQLLYELEPILMVFQEQHVISKDWRALGFMTSQLNFSNQLILKRLAPAEKVLLTPYLKFVEEQVAMPWQRVCNSAAQHEQNSPMIALVEQMLPESENVARTVYRRLTELLPNYQSRRGALTHPGITHSCLRDMNMFQAYLWLCLLERSVAPMKHELLPLCVMVVQGVEIPWELTEQWCQILGEEIASRIQPEQRDILRPYTQALQQIFFEERERLRFPLAIEVDAADSPVSN